MKKMLLMLVVGVAAGYQVGWNDAQKHDQSIVERTIEKVGGSTRGKYQNDVDKQLERLEKR
ncbi:MAG: hypothetical protein ACT4P7_06810 [Gemmatimonadaceae bacterium]